MSQTKAARAAQLLADAVSLRKLFRLPRFWVKGSMIEGADPANGNTQDIPDGSWNENTKPFFCYCLSGGACEVTGKAGKRKAHTRNANEIPDGLYVDPFLPTKRTERLIDALATEINKNETFSERANGNTTPEGRVIAFNDHHNTTFDELRAVLNGTVRTLRRNLRALEA